MIESILFPTSKANSLLTEGERTVWWKEEKDGWTIKVAQSGKFLYTKWE